MCRALGGGGACGDDPCGRWSLPSLHPVHYADPPLSPHSPVTPLSIRRQLAERVLANTHAEALYELVNIVGSSSVRPTLGKDNDAIRSVDQRAHGVKHSTAPHTSQSRDPRRRSDPARQPVLMIDSAIQSSNVRTPTDERLSVAIVRRGSDGVYVGRASETDF